MRGTGKDALEPALRVAAGVDEVRVFESKFVRAEKNVIHTLYANHERMVLVGDLVLPRGWARADEVCGTGRERGQKNSVSVLIRA